MKLALECPTSMLNDIQPLADFDWILAHLLLGDDKYAEYYSQSTRYKVLDNSVNELLSPVNLGYLRDAARLVDPNLIVAPDYLGDSGSTWFALKESIRMFGKEKVFPVIQGSTLGDVSDLLEKILSLDLGRIAVPYDILSTREATPEEMASNRTRVVHSIEVKVPIGFEIHLLGFTTINELSRYGKGWVKSIDTGVPVMMGQKGYRLDKNRLVDKKQPTMSIMERTTSVDPEFSKQTIYYNIAYLRKLLQ